MLLNNYPPPFAPPLHILKIKIFFLGERKKPYSQLPFFEQYLITIRGGDCPLWGFVGCWFYLVVRQGGVGFSLFHFFVGPRLLF
jgi:hypothetical protein